MASILFTPEQHLYINTVNGLPYMSVSHFVKLFQDDFKGQHHARKRAAEKCIGSKKYEELYDAWTADGVSHTLQPEYIPYLEKHIPHLPSYEKEVLRVLEGYQTESVKGRTKGTNHHDWSEMASNMRGYEIFPPDGSQYPVRKHGRAEDGSNRNVVDKLNQLEWGFYSELMIWFDFPEPVFSESVGTSITGICGQADKVFISMFFDFFLQDYKTGKAKKLDDFGVKYRNLGFEYMLYPFNKLRNHAKNRYTLQLGLYSWMLEQQHGLKCIGADILYKEDVIKIPIMRSAISEAVSMVFSTGM